MKDQRASHPGALRVTPTLLRRWPLPQPPEDGDKEDRGRLLLIAGSEDMPGAAILAATAALRAGVGKLCIVTARSGITSVAQAVPEARVVPFRSRQARSEPEVALLDDFDAIVIGPGMKASRSLPRIVHAGFSRAKTTLILDAGALHTLGTKKSRVALADGSSQQPQCIVTPHAGEMAKLLGLDKSYVESHASRVALTFAKTRHVTVVLKGAATLIAEPSGKLWIHDKSNVGLAASGSGDVLAGIIGGLAARGASCAQAAVWGVALHAMAGQRLVAQHGNLGSLARELPHHVPALMHELRRSGHRYAI